jgi:TRAP-type C4-dicarboxylate transport system permease small subunit
VVWVGFIGAAIATREGKHLNIDVVSRWLTGAGSNYIRLISHFFSTAVCGLLTLAAIKFIHFEAQMGGTAFFKLPVWVPEIIIPVTFGLMTLRFSVRFLSEFAKIRRHDFKQEFKEEK